MFNKNRWAWWLGGVLIVTAVLAAALKQLPHRGVQGTNFEDSSKKPNVADIVEKNAPVVEGFVGDLETGGTKENDDTVPFVIGDTVKLEATALNATEYRWTVDGKVLKDSGLEWTVKKDREWDVTVAGEHTFGVQVRGTDPHIVSQAREKTLSMEKMHIVSFEPNITQQDTDRELTKSEFTVECTMVIPLSTDIEYRYRYSVNDEVVKTEDGDEWRDDDSFTYSFPAPGKYAFKVEVRRSTEKEPEASAVMAQTIEVADAVLTSFEASPEKSAAPGSKVDLSVWPESLLAKSECRFGVRKIDAAADFQWLNEEDGSIWGADSREWQPSEPGLYMLRAEVREAGKDQADDYRELRYQINEGGF